MDKKRITVSCIIIFAAVLLNIYVIKYLNLGYISDKTAKMNMQVCSEYTDEFSVYYSDDDKFSEDQTDVVALDTVGESVELSFDVQPQTYIRLDFGVGVGNVTIESLSMTMYGETVDLMSYLSATVGIEELNCVGEFSATEQGGVSIQSLGEDPYVVFAVDAETAYASFENEFSKKNMVIRVIMAALIDILVVLVLIHLREYTSIPLEIVRNRKLIISLSKNDFKTRFAGSYLGIIWAFVQPVITVLVYWFVFEKAMYAGRVSEYPYVLWLMSGLVPWFYFSEAWNGGTNALVEYNYLVKKVVFHISILPVVKTASSLYTHIFFATFVFVFCWGYGYTPDLYSLQLVYYIFASFLLVLGLSYLTSAIVCFFKDMTQIINIVLQIGIWMTPIMWDVSMLSPSLAKVFKLNPVYYIVKGFRNALLAKQWFWSDMAWTLYFWMFVIALFLFGTRIFQKLKIHFADVL